MKKIIVAAMLVAGLTGVAHAKGWEDDSWMNGWCHGSLAQNYPIPFGLAC